MLRVVTSSKDMAPIIFSQSSACFKFQREREKGRESAREREHERSERGVFACLQFSVKHTHMTLTHSIHTNFTHSIYI